MPRTVRTKVYKFKELSEQAKEKAIESLYDINVNYDWWEFTYDDAEEINLKITGFDIDRGSYCEGELTGNPMDTVKAILENHGKTCDTYKSAKSFLIERIGLFRKAITSYKEEQFDPEDEKPTMQEWLIDNYEEELDELAEEFKENLLSDYLALLRAEYEYQTSGEAVIEAIEANEYEFTVDGKLF